VNRRPVFCRFDLKWLQRMRDIRALMVTPAGRRGLSKARRLSLWADAARYEQRFCRPRRTGRDRFCPRRQKFALTHDAEKWVPVFGKHHAQTIG
jgi:hypothetical protein